MQDRIAAPGRAGYVQLTPVAEESNVYKMTMADQATQRGTDYSKAAVLKDATAAMYGLGSTALPDQVFAALGNAVMHSGNTIYDALNNKLGEILYVETGTYEGTGSGTPSLTFNIEPLLVLIYSTSGTGTAIGQALLTGGSNVGTVNHGINVETAPSRFSGLAVTWTNDGKTASWDSNDSAEANMNTSGVTYSYMALGINPDGEPVVPPVPAMSAQEAFDILANAAFVEKTVSGSEVSFSDGANDIPVDDLSLAVHFTQSGSGNPTPEYVTTPNVRPITAWAGATVNVGAVSGTPDETYTVDWTSDAGTIGIGTLDVTTGVLTVTHGYALLTTTGGDNPWGTAGSRHIARYVVPGAKSGGTRWSDKFASLAAGSNDYAVQITANNTIAFSTPVADFADLTAWNTWAAAHPIQVVYELATPQPYQLTPTEVATLLGTNYIWADAGNVTVTYRADTGLAIAEKVPDAPSTNGTYVLKATVSGGSVTYAWVAE